MMNASDYAIIFVVLALVVVITIDIVREQRRERKRRNGYPWQAVSPSATFIVAVADEIEAVKLVATIGKVSFIDRDRRVIFFDTHLGGENPPGG